MTRKLPKDAFYAQFHNSDHHEHDDPEYERPYSHEVPDPGPSNHPHPDYSRKKKKHRVVHKAMKIVMGG